MFSSKRIVVDEADGLNQVQRKYLNCTVIGTASASANPNTGTPCIYSQVYGSAILDNPAEWSVGIVRFTIPFLRVPRFIDPQFDGTATPMQIRWTNANGNLGPFGITVNVSPSAPPTGFTSIATDPFNTSYIYLVQNLIDAVQQAFNRLTIVANLTLVTPIIAPLITFNAATNIVTIQAPQGAFTPGLGVGGNGPISCFFNEPLWRFFPTLPFQFNNYTANGQTSDLYALIRIGNTSGSVGGGTVAVIAETLTNINSGNIGTVNSTGVLSTALVAGTATSQLLCTGLIGDTLAAGQALLLIDSVSGAQQTVFVAQRDTRLGSASITVLLFTPVFNFPITTTTINLTERMCVVVTALTVSIPTGTALVINTAANPTQIVTSRAASVGDIIVYCQPFRPSLSVATTTINFSVPPSDIIVTESPVPSTWTSISAVRVKTSYLPINPEFAPAIVGTTVATPTQQLPTVQMVTDFVINATSAVVTDDVVQFVTEQPRWIDMFGSLPVNTIDLTCVWVDMQGAEHPIYIPQGFRFDMKLAFKRKYTKCLPGF